MSDIIRSRSIAVSHETHWALRMLAKANRAMVGPMDTPGGVDAIAENILSNHIHTHFAYLEDAYASRKAIDDQAVERLRNPV